MIGYDKKDPNPAHVAIIMDGNGRWAQNRGLPRRIGHKQGVEALKKIVQSARDHNISYLTLFSFSSENWSRPRSEIKNLMALLKHFIRKDLAELHHHNIRIRVIGERTGLPEDVVPLLDEAENLTVNNTAQTLVIAFNYSGRCDIVNGMKRLMRQVQEGRLAIDDISAEHLSQNLYTAGIPDPDLLIRTSGEQRLSNFILWQSAYTEFVFVDSLWPDFDPVQFSNVLNQYRKRDRRYGNLSNNQTV